MKLSVEFRKHKKMNIKKIIARRGLIIFIVMFFLNVSAFAEALKVDISDGVSKEEAVIIAQNYLIKEGLDKLLNIKKWKIMKSMTKDDEYWSISFSTRFIVKITQGLLYGYVDVNKKTGEVIYKGEEPTL